MNKYLCFLLLLVVSPSGYAQQKVKDYVQKNLALLRSISPDEVDFSDLEAIGAAVGDARIVMLGEQTHGDGSTMQAKTRLVKYLHERKGFDVLAFEGDFFGLTAGWGQVQKSPAGVKSFLWRNLHNVWPACAQFADLLNVYLPGTYLTQNPLEVCGFDNQVGYAYSNALLKDSIDQYLRRRQIAYTNSEGYTRKFLPTLSKFKGRFWEGDENVAGLQRFVAAADTVLAQLGPGAFHDFGYLTLESARSFAQQSLAHGNKVVSSNLRDAQMAKNLKWLATHKYPNRKIIVWAASGHIIKNTDTAMKDKSDAAITCMGTWFARNSALERQTYVLGFTSLQGAWKFATSAKGYSVQRPRKGAFETWIDPSLAYGFVDFRRFRGENPGFREVFSMKGHGPNNKLANWTNVFDGVFYIRDMEPCGTVRYN
ncbi:erythromycin esterase family protein [Rufibacter psychrotolerans]|uniref:erythromycin esterase family protein n=1 Tax=Rufibacter psychrotolerans TaxID=2812556 RepID=UPI001968331E|nr:erythromycin esterase family protein [Rufibacter sp. SYSU D00308]